ncbi:MAG TPA: ferredoxin-type protein NapF [Pasteurellaceae bacterium]|nr:ferredoxin-type protein NapF [Pasteurellaceae bacterium]
MEKDERYYKAYLSHHWVSRRGLFRGVFGGAEKSYAQLHGRQVARPPFAAKESLFAYACNGCAECVTVCPYGLIHIRNNQAVLEIDFSACDFCGLCAKACQTNALNPAFTADTELRPQFNLNCIRQKGQVCDLCQQNCPQQAISPSLTVDSQRCNGCGECKLSCFVNGITLSLSN